MEVPEERAMSDIPWPLHFLFADACRTDPSVKCSTRSRDRLRSNQADSTVALIDSPKAFTADQSP
jgi:hypothetical protein